LQQRDENFLDEVQKIEHICPSVDVSKIIQPIQFSEAIWINLIHWWIRRNAAKHQFCNGPSTVSIGNTNNNFM